MNFLAKSEWRTPAGLVALTAIPALAGIVRLVVLAHGATITPENARFFAAPLPVAVHIVGASLFCLLGAFQFSAPFRRRRPDWHRISGRILVPCGLAAGLSGLWMTQFYPLPGGLQGPLLYGVRLLVGSGMVLSILLSLAAILRGDIAPHRAWMMRAYALGQGAGTQAVILLPITLLLASPIGLTRDLLMTLGWVVNLAAAEWILRRH